MKTSSVVASLLFGSMAAAVPLNKRVYVTKTNVVTETVVVVTTVYDGEVATSAPEVAASSTPGLFFEKPSSSSVYVAPSTSSTEPAATPTPEAPKTSPTTSSTYSPPPVSTPTPTPEQKQEQPTTTQQATSAAVEATSAAAPAQTSSSSSSSGSGEVHTGGSITMNYFSGGTGACGKPIQDTDMAVALASDLFGASTYDPATGNPTNKWCNVNVAITYNGNTQNAVIMDRCEGCTGGGFDMTPALWKAITGGVGGSSGDRLSGATWQVAS